MPVTDEESALEAIGTLTSLSNEQKDAQSKIQVILASDEPFIDIHELLGLYDILYFRSLLLPRVEASWSSRLTLCAGICELVRDPDNGNKYTRIRLKLSEPLLKYRPRSDVINTLLHEAIHAYFFITTSWRHSRGDDGTGHGAGFLLLADAINDHGGYEVTVFHTFHDEVDSYRTHVWKCDGPCQQQAPFFGLVKRSMNRAPGKSDHWWQKHLEECGGTFSKIAEPELTKEQLGKMSGLKRAGRQANKIDGYVKSAKEGLHSGADDHLNRADDSHSINLKRPLSPADSSDRSKRVREMVSCPICELDVAIDTINEHMDLNHPV